MIVSCIAVFISWYIFTGYLIVVTMRADHNIMFLLALAIIVIVYVIMKVIKQLKKQCM